MCTLTWFHTAHGYELFFNRDESIERQRAEIPVVKRQQGIDYIAPTDTDAGGTWISVNALGVTVCLLNHYQFEQIKTYKQWVSRGVLVRCFADVVDVIDAKTRFASLNLEDYRAFRLFVLTAEGDKQLFVWDGHEPRIESHVSQPKSSSSVDAKHVKGERRTLYHSMNLHDSKDVAAHLAFHRSHVPTASKESVCMHRPEANTVSLSHVSVASDQIQFAYADGAPCQASFAEPVWLERRFLGEVKRSISL